MTMRSMIVAALIVLALFGAVVVSVWRSREGAIEAPLASDTQLLQRLGRNVDDVALQNVDGVFVRWDELNGSPRALFFGFTHCPEICPSTVAALDAARSRLGPEGEKLRLDFVTVDPARDTAPVLKAYFASFAGSVRAFGGEEKEIGAIAASFRAAHRKVPLTEGDYTIDHTTTVYLLNADGVVVDTIAYGASVDTIEQQLRRLVQ